MVFLSTLMLQGKDAEAGIPFKIHRGVSLSCWLSQASPEIEENAELREAYVTRKDLAFIEAQGFDHVRIPIDERLLYEADGEPNESYSVLLRDCIEWALELKLKVVIDLHLARFHIFTENQPFWSDPALQEELTRFWLRFSEDFGHYPNSEMAYELMNEPVPPGHDTELWNVIYLKTVEQLRQKEPGRTLIVGPGHWNSLKEISEMRVPENDPNIMLTFHMYEPYLLTHYKAGWAMHRSYDGPVSYPGTIVALEDLEDLAPDVRSWMLNEYLAFDLGRMEQLILEAVKMRKKFNLPVYCGEFGCYHAVPREIRLRWYRDVINIFRKYDIPYCHWDYKCRNEFGIVTEQGKVDQLLIDIITGK